MLLVRSWPRSGDGSGPLQAGGWASPRPGAPSWGSPAWFWLLVWRRWWAAWGQPAWAPGGAGLRGNPSLGSRVLMAPLALWRACWVDAPACGRPGSVPRAWTQGGLGARPHMTPVTNLSEPQCPCLPTPWAPLGSGRFQRSGEVPGVKLGPQPLGEAPMSGSAPAGGAHQGSQVLPGGCLSHEPHPQHAHGGALPQHFSSPPDRPPRPPPAALKPLLLLGEEGCVMGLLLDHSLEWTVGPRPSLLPGPRIRPPPPGGTSSFLPRAVVP